MIDIDILPKEIGEKYEYPDYKRAHGPGGGFINDIELKRKPLDCKAVRMIDWEAVDHPIQEDCKDLFSAELLDFIHQNLESALHAADKVCKESNATRNDCPYGKLWRVTYLKWDCVNKTLKLYLQFQYMCTWEAPKVPKK